MKKLSIATFVISLMILSCKTEKKGVCNLESQKLEKASSILGVDISHFQNNINWNDIKSDSINFVYIKATEGTDYQDPKFKKNRASAKSNCIYRGLYHFYVTDNDPKGQAQNFINTVKQLEPGDLPPVLDLEKLGLKSAVTKEAYQKNTLLWLQLVEKELGIRPIVYTNLFFANEYLTHSDFASYKLWLAEYTNEDLIIPETWKNNGWTIWQRTDREKIEGIKGDVDYDLFNGDATAFRKLLKK
ncbi:glycoside hydrolase family 25 protein [Aquimarina sp. I32.4]|uniref:glycoside hydrolase family 25 protein n=1 Tax=Aquimarina sp. I32.4 TaxID=2053903 RepID=UPI000CDEAB71|nr:glycoside hydrolase family 25 protein [Aquimarina sp. I32.4]